MVSESKPSRRRTAYGPAAKPGYHKGRTPANKGRRLPTPVLSRQEVGVLLDAFTERPSHVRDKALVWLAYRHALKSVQLLALDASQYEPARGRLVVAATKRHPEMTISIDSETRDLLDRWMATRAHLGIRPFAPLFCTTTAASRGQPIKPSYLREKLPAVALSAGVPKRVTIEALRASGRERFAGRAPSVEALIEHYVDGEGLRKRHREAYDKWHDAQVFFRADPGRYGTQIGHNCREALAAFANQAVADCEADVPASAGTRDKLSAVFAQKVRSATERKFLNALLAYWRAVSDLAQRQEHAGLREAEVLTEEDARRIIFETMLVMFEVDRALAAT
jgi:Phage integrase family